MKRPTAATQIIGLMVLLLIAGSVGTYYLYILPKQQTEKLDFEKKKYADEQASKDAEKRAVEDAATLKAAADEENKHYLEICLTNAGIHRQYTWDSNCADVASITRNFNSGISKQYRMPDVPETNCSLPKGRADAIIKGFEDEKDECFKKYQLGTFTSDDMELVINIPDGSANTNTSNIVFNPFNYEKNENNYYVLTGSISSNCSQIFITARNDDAAIDETPWELKTQYKPGDTSFSYNISANFRTASANAAPGNNEYTATANCGGKVVTDTIQIYFSASDL